MKILLDENLPTKVKYDFGEGFEIFTVRGMEWLGKSQTSAGRDGRLRAE